MNNLRFEKDGATKFVNPQFKEILMGEGWKLIEPEKKKAPVKKKAK